MSNQELEQAVMAALAAANAPGVADVHDAITVRAAAAIRDGDGEPPQAV
jgi:hypothetical protein